MTYLKQMIRLSGLLLLMHYSANVFSQRQMENLSRGIVALRQSADSVFISWRLLGTDPDNIAFNLYRNSGGKSTKLNTQPLTESTYFVDTKADFTYSNAYLVKAVIKGKESEASRAYTLP